MEGGPAIDRDAVHASLPHGLAVNPADGTVRDVNDHVLTMLGLPRDEVVGRSVLDFVHADDVGFAVDLLTEAPAYRRMITGPVHIAYLDGEGRHHTTHIWSRTCLDVPGIDGYVVTISEAATAEMLPTAVRAIAARAPLDEVLAHVISALSGHPILALATMVVHRDDGTVPLGPWPIGSTASLDDPEGDAPWTLAVRRSAAVDVEIGADGRSPAGAPDPVPARLGSVCAAYGIQALWCRPVVASDGRVPAVLIAWRDKPGAPSSNQRRHLDDAAGIAALAFDQESYRASMERAAYVDPVSGLGNRTRFERVLDEGETGSADVEGVLYLDLDGFKDVNDRYGHAIGDQILAHAGARLRGVVRSVDEVVRVGGDEFVVLCRRPGPVDGVETLADRVIRVLAEPYAVDGHEPVRVGASVGVEVGGHERPLRARVEAADRAMYQAKAVGKGVWRRAAEVPGPAERA